MSEEGSSEGPSEETQLHNLRGVTKDVVWSFNWKRELLDRYDYPPGSAQNPRDGFWNWFNKFKFFNKKTLDRDLPGWSEYDQSLQKVLDKRQKVREPWIPTKFRPNKDDPVNKVLKNLNRPGTDLVDKAYRAIKGEEQGWTLPGYRYIGPGNPVYTGDDATLSEPDKVAKEHDIEYSRIATTSKTEEELRSETDKADTRAIQQFWDKSDISGQLIKGEFPNFGAFIGASGLYLKRAYERQFGQVYPSINSEYYFMLQFYASSIGTTP